MKQAVLEEASKFKAKENIIRLEDIPAICDALFVGGVTKITIKSSGIAMVTFDVLSNKIKSREEFIHTLMLCVGSEYDELEISFEVYFGEDTPPYVIRLKGRP